MAVLDGWLVDTGREVAVTLTQATYRMSCGLGLQECGERFAQQRRCIMRLGAIEDGKRERCKRRGATSDSSEQRAASRRAAAATGKGARPASGLRNDSLGRRWRRWRGSRSLKRAFCRSLGPKQAVAPASRDDDSHCPGPQLHYRLQDAGSVDVNLNTASSMHRCRP